MRRGPADDLNTGEATTPRESASLILLRDSPDGPEVLLVQRNPEARFMGGAWVFPGGSTHRDDGDEERTARRELEEEAGISLSADAELVRYSRWITPAQIETRFDTHFFVARAPEDAEPRVDGSECVGARWIRPADALEAGRRDELALVFPTIKHLEQLAAFPSVAAALEAAASRQVTPVQPRIVVTNGRPNVLLPGEPGFDADEPRG